MRTTIAIALCLGCGSTRPSASPTAGRTAAPTSPSTAAVGATEPTCTTALRHAFRFDDDLSSDVGMTSNHPALIAQCEGEHWSLDARRCIARITKWDQLPRCAPLLPEQPTCRTALKHAIALVPGEHTLIGLNTGAGLDEHCEATKWSLEMRRCVAAIATWDDFEGCAQRLLTKQQLEWRSNQPAP